MFYCYPGSDRLFKGWLCDHWMDDPESVSEFQLVVVLIRIIGTTLDPVRSRRDERSPEQKEDQLSLHIDSVMQILQYGPAITTKQRALCRDLLEEILAFLPGPPTPQKLAKLDLPSEESRQLLLNSFVPLFETMVAAMPEEDIILKYVENGRGEDVLAILTEAIKVSVPCKRRDRLVYFVCHLIDSDAFLFSTVRPSFDLVDRWQWQEEWLLCVTSLPDVLANTLEKHLPSQLVPATYLRSIAVQLAKCIFIFSEALKHEVDVKVEPLAVLIKHMCAKYDASYLLDPLMPLMERLTRDNFIARRVWSLLIRSLDDRCLDKIVGHLTQWAYNTDTFQRLLGVVHFPLQERWCRVLCTKPLFLRQYSSDRVGRNVLTYLSQDQDTLLKVTVDLLAVWSEKNALLLTSPEQHEFVSRCLIIAIGLLNAEILAGNRPQLHGLLTKGVNHHLESAQLKTRILGMFVAEACTRRIYPDGPPLKFTYDRTQPDIQNLESLLHPEEVQSDDQDSVDFEALLKQTRDNLDKFVSLVSPKSLPIKSYPGEDKVGAHPSETIAQAPVDDLDSDDDLEPYDMSEDTVASKWEAPRYIRDVMDMLGNAENDEDAYQRELLSLGVSEAIIREQLPREHPSLARQFLKILIDLQDKFSIPDFHVLRMKALVAICVSHPQESASFLTQEFYQPNYSICQRLDMLHVITAVSKELSSQPIVSQAISSQSPHLPEEDWRSIVQLRIESKTRRFFPQSSTVKNPVTFQNGFSAVAGCFFFPLAEKLDQCLTFLKLMDEDFVLMSTLLCTLAAIVYCSGPVAIVSRMVRSLVDIVWLLRLHRQSGVRESALVAFIQSLMVTSKDTVVSHYAFEMVEWKHWLVHTSVEDPSPEVRSLAQHALSLLQHLLS